jgi:hypothetical protein
MRSNTLILFIQFIIVGSAFSQSQLGSTEVLKKERQAVLRYVSFTPNVVEGAIKMRMDELGNRGRENKNLINLGKGSFYLYKSVTLPREQNPTDLYIKVEPRFKKDQSESSIYLVVMKLTGDFATSEGDPELIEKAKVFLNDLNPYLEAYYLEVIIKNQEELVSKLNSKINDLIQDSISLEKRVQGLKEKLQLNKTEKEQQRVEMERQIEALEGMKKRRKSA